MLWPQIRYALCLFLDMVKSKNLNFTLAVDDDGRPHACYTSVSTITGTVVLELLKDMTPMLFLKVMQVYVKLQFHACDGYSRQFTNSKYVCAAIAIGTQIVWYGHDFHQVTGGLVAGVY